MLVLSVVLCTIAIFGKTHWCPELILKLTTNILLVENKNAKYSDTVLSECTSLYYYHINVSWYPVLFND